MNLHVDVQVACTETVPGQEQLQRWIAAALAQHRAVAEVSVRFVEEAEMTALNRRYRGRDSSTNVLSFPADLPADLQHPLLGDIVACPAVVAREAREQHKDEQQHWAHMLVHGSLHLVGFDHVDPADAEEMEALEITILESLGCPSPYRETTAGACS